MKAEELECGEKTRRRHQAEELARHMPSVSQRSLSYPDVLRLVQELEVHQIELELQREELEQARIDIETGLEKFEDLYDYAPVGYFTLDETGTIQLANLTGADLLGVERSRLIKRHFQLSVAPAAQATFKAFLNNVFAGRVKCECEIALVTHRGDQLETELEATPVASHPGRTRQCRAVVKDITARKQTETERRQMEGRDGRTQKLDNSRIMAGGIAHDLDNLLTVIRDNAELALAEEPTTLPTRARLQEIVKTAQRAAAVSRQMLAFWGERHLTMAPSATEARALPVKSGAGPPPAWRGSGLVLLVDDEEVVRDLGRQLLERLGFTVVTAEDGRAAVDIFADHAPEIVCVLLDLTMPRMDGREALRELRRRRPDAPVMICSDIDPQRMADLFPDTPDSLAFLLKPFQWAEFSETLRFFLTVPAGSRSPA